MLFAVTWSHLQAPACVRSHLYAALIVGPPNAQLIYMGPGGGTQVLVPAEQVLYHWPPTAASGFLHMGSENQTQVLRMGWRGRGKRSAHRASSFVFVALQP